MEVLDAHQMIKLFLCLYEFPHERSKYLWTTLENLKVRIEIYCRKINKHVAPA